jgi:fimbrial isopeptide formation D2 family protein
MKKLNLFFAMAAALFFMKPEDSAAQVTALSGKITDSTSIYCILPNNFSFQIYGSVTGTGTITDSVTVNVNFGDGTDSTFKRKIYFGTPGYFSAYIYHNYTIAGTYTARMIATAPSGIKDTSYSSSYTLSNTCGTLNGYLYMDANSNCVKDAGENAIYWTPVVAINTTTLDSMNAGWADHTGHYSLTLPPGNYNIIPNHYYTTSAGLTKANIFATPTCPSSGAYALTVAASGSYTKDFAYSCTAPTSYDAKVTVAGGCFFPGDTTMVYVWGGSWSWYYAYSCLSIGVGTTVTTTLDSKLSYLGVSYGPTPSVSGSTLTYTLSTVADLNHFYSGILVRTATTATIGDTIRISAYIAPLTTVTDPNLANNTYNYKKAVVSSYDPNIKEVAPLGKGTQGYIAKNEEMTYTIHFQNTGTAAARNITITDEIDADLDINSIHILGATHNSNIYREGSKIKFRFENINLPDSGTNYAGSMGSITYAIKQKKDLASGTQMTNTAAIYFDYNSPIITNTTLNTIEIPTSIENVNLGDALASIYPNPANTMLNVKLNNNQAFTSRMMDMLGRVVITQSSNNGTMIMDTQSLTNGMYIINIADDKGNQLSSKVQIKH